MAEKEDLMPIEIRKRGQILISCNLCMDNRLEEVVVEGHEEIPNLRTTIEGLGWRMITSVGREPEVVVVCPRHYITLSNEPMKEVHTHKDAFGLPMVGLTPIGGPIQ